MPRRLDACLYWPRVGSNELLDVIFRWAHLIAGIMWIGNSMLFNWLDRNLEKAGALPRLSQGKIYMVHSGAFYDVEKKLLAPGEMPRTLHWFKWQNGITWMTGIALLVIVYYMNGAAFLVDPVDPGKLIAQRRDHALGRATLLTGWIIYDGLWRTYRRAQPARRDGAVDRDAVRRDLRLLAGLQRARRVHPDRRADRHADDRQRLARASCRRSAS